MDAETWSDEFDSEIEESGIRDTWKLFVDDDLQSQEKGLRYAQHTFGRFRCSLCRRSWNSAEVHVLFLMNLNKYMKQGTVRMRIFKQECKKCKFPLLEKPEVSLENVSRIIRNVCSRIQQVFYGQKRVNPDLKPELYSNNMEGPHDKEHCEACRLHICKWQTMTAKIQPEIEESPSTPHQSRGSFTDRLPRAPAQPQRETSTGELVVSIIVGLGALTLWLLKR
ncbi:receptor-transporting protein 4-like [Pseudophryne corroboree]|uniref:receptor-transporting protein 4-like n=1 Tax=Pseudophryne corroboree TaxID=495146 RepID=UPI003081B5D9